jgi:hypothetical protein
VESPTGVDGQLLSGTQVPQSLVPGRAVRDSTSFSSTMVDLSIAIIVSIMRFVVLARQKRKKTVPRTNDEGIKVYMVLFAAMVLSVSFVEKGSGGRQHRPTVAAGRVGINHPPNVHILW